MPKEKSRCRLSRGQGTRRLHAGYTGLAPLAAAAMALFVPMQQAPCVLLQPQTFVEGARYNCYSCAGVLYFSLYPVSRYGWICGDMGDTWRDTAGYSGKWGDTSGYGGYSERYSGMHTAGGNIGGYSRIQRDTISIYSRAGLLLGTLNCAISLPPVLSARR